jgi:hypothetical protein
MKLTTIAVTLLVLAGCHKNGSEPNQTPATTGLTPAETQGAENSAGSYPAGPTAVPGNSGVGATGVEDPIDQPPAPDTPTK